MENKFVRCFLVVRATPPKYDAHVCRNYKQLFATKAFLCILNKITTVLFNFMREIRFLPTFVFETKRADPF